VINVTRADLSILQSIPRAELLKRVRFIVEASYASRFLLSAVTFASGGGVDLFNGWAHRHHNTSNAIDLFYYHVRI
jgi:hypothetical protein